MMNLRKGLFDLARAESSQEKDAENEVRKKIISASLKHL